MTSAATLVMPLQSGDRLTREQFHRRYRDNPQIRRAELIEGVVYVASPMRFDQHDEPVAMVAGWLFVYVAKTSGVRHGGSATIYLDVNTEVQPDGFLFREPPSWPGGARRRADGYIDGAPDLVVEIAASSASYDLHDKMEAYRRAGVQEYVVWRTLDHAVDWFRLREGQYVRLEPNERGVIVSEIFPGLRLAVEKLLAGDRAGLIGELEEPPDQAG